MTVLSSDAVLEVGPKGTKPAPHTTERDAQIVQRVARMGIVRQTIGVVTRPIEAVEGDEPRTACG